MSGFYDFDAESDDRVEDALTCTGVASDSNAFAAKLGAADGLLEPHARMANTIGGLKYEDGPRMPLPTP